MKQFIFGLLITALGGAASAETLVANSELKDKDIYNVIYQSAEDFLAYDDGDVSGGLYGDLKSPTIVELDITNGAINFMKVKYSAYIYTADADFGDPVHEEFTDCTTELTKNLAGQFTVELAKTVCDINPKVDFKNDQYSDRPCCDGKSPIVDSNMCFDSVEEAGDFCTSN